MLKCYCQMPQHCCIDPALLSYCGFLSLPPITTDWLLYLNYNSFLNLLTYCIDLPAFLLILLLVAWLQLLQCHLFACCSTAATCHNAVAINSACCSALASCGWLLFSNYNCCFDLWMFLGSLLLLSLPLIVWLMWSLTARNTSCIAPPQPDAACYMTTAECHGNQEMLKYCCHIHNANAINSASLFCYSFLSLLAITAMQCWCLQTILAVLQ